MMYEASGRALEAVTGQRGTARMIHEERKDGLHVETNHRFSDVF